MSRSYELTFLNLILLENRRHSTRRKRYWEKTRLMSYVIPRFWNLPVVKA